MNRFRTYLECANFCGEFKGAVASVKIVSGSEEHPVSGYILLTQADDTSPVYIRGEIRGLKAVPHGFHIHEIGSTNGKGKEFKDTASCGFEEDSPSESLYRICHILSLFYPSTPIFTLKISTDGCEAAGATFNPFVRSHGAGEEGERPVGDWGNIFTPEAENHVTLIDIVDDVISLYDAEDNIVGRTLVLHRYEEEDIDHSGHESRLKSGNAGGVRVACGVVEQEINAKTAIVGISDTTNIVLTQVKAESS